MSRGCYEDVSDFQTASIEKKSQMEVPLFFLQKSEFSLG